MFIQTPPSIEDLSLPPKPSSVIFVTRRGLTPVTGDDRLSTDLARILAKHMGCESRIICDRFAHKVTLQTMEKDPQVLVIGVNLPYEFSRSVPTPNYLSVNIKNDRKDSPCDILFNPFFNPLTGDGIPPRILLKIKVIPIETLPTRVNKASLRKAVKKYPLPPLDASEQKKTTIAFFVREMNDREFPDFLELLDTIAAKQPTRFLFATGPSTSWPSEDLVVCLSKRHTDTHCYFWNRQGGRNNPYLSFIGHADAVVTSGTLSTTCDLLNSGKPVYFWSRTQEIADDFRKGVSCLIGELTGSDVHFIAHMAQQERVKMLTASEVAKGLCDLPSPAAPISNEWTKTAREFAAYIRMLPRQNCNYVLPANNKPDLI